MGSLAQRYEAILQELQANNLTANAGRVEVGQELITLSPTGIFTTVEDFERLVLSSVSGTSQIYLGDVANVRRGYQDPSVGILHFDGKPAIGLGISTVAGGNVVTMGNALKVRMDELMEEIPVGIEFGVIAMQPEAVVTSINGFLISLGQAVLIPVRDDLAEVGVDLSVPFDTPAMRMSALYERLAAMVIEPLVQA